MDIFEQTNWDFINKFSNILVIIKIQFSQQFRDFKIIYTLQQLPTI